MLYCDRVKNTPKQEPHSLTESLLGRALSRLSPTCAAALHFTARVPARARRGLRRGRWRRRRGRSEAAELREPREVALRHVGERGGRREDGHAHVAVPHHREVELTHLHSGRVRCWVYDVEICGKRRLVRFETALENALNCCKSG